MVQMWTRNGGRDVLFDELIYETGLTNPLISEAINEYHIPYDDQIIADSSEPKSIQELIDLGHNVQAVKKGEDSVRFGISLMK
jgi:phage terminase large subunit